MSREIPRELSGAGRRFGIVLSAYNSMVGERLLEGALATLAQHGVADGDVLVARVPGAFELPAAAAAMLRRADIAGCIALGCVVRGGTPHFEYVCTEASRGLMDVSLHSGKAFGFGLLTTDDMEQALARAGGSEGNKGAEAAQACLEMCHALHALGTP